MLLSLAPSWLLAALVTMGMAQAFIAEADEERTAEGAAIDPSVGFRVLVGGHVLTSRPGAMPSGIANASDRGGVLATTGLSIKARPHFFLGAAMDIEGSEVDVGDQVFGIATLRVMATAEKFLRAGDYGHSGITPYVTLGAGWNFNSTGAKIEYPLGGPDGVALGYDVSNSLAVRVGLGVERQVSREGLRVKVEGGWIENEGTSRMTFQNRPDKEGRFRLGGGYLLVGIGAP